MILIVSAALLAGCREKAASPASAPNLSSVSVRLETVGMRPDPRLEAVPGTVESRAQAVIEARLTARIAAVPSAVGRRATAGEILIRLEAPELQARLSQTEAGLDLAERDWKRVQALFATEAATRAERDAVESRLHAARGAHAEATAMLQQLEISAPFDGVITRKWAEPGDLATPGKPLLQLEDDSNQVVVAEVPEALGRGLKQGRMLAIRPEAMTAELMGELIEVTPSSDPVSHTVRVKVALPSGSLGGAGQFVRVLVPAGEREVITIPESSVQQRGQMEQVYVVVEGRARMRLVRTSPGTGNRREVQAGLSVGDQVVVEPAGQVVEGQPVTSPPTAGTGRDHPSPSNPADPLLGIEGATR